MKPFSQIRSLRQQFDLTDEHWLIAQYKAEQIGLDISEYISLLIEEDRDPGGPVPILEKVQWALELARQEQNDSATASIHELRSRLMQVDFQHVIQIGNLDDNNHDRATMSNR